jgi:hypothetical protein
MGSGNDFDEIIHSDENDIFIADTDPFDLGDRSSIAIISGNHERMEFPSPNKITNLCQDAHGLGTIVAFAGFSIDYITC